MLEEKVNNNQEEEIDIESQPPYASHPGLKDWVYRLILFLTGFLALDIVTLIIELILQAIIPEYFTEGSAYYVTGLAMMNTIRYVLLTMVFVILLYPRLKILVRKFLNWKDDLIGIGFGVALILITICYNLLISQFVDPGTNNNEIYAEQMILSYPALSIIVLGILGPVCEEITYRYGLFSLLDKKSKILAYILTPIVFALIHFDFTGNMKVELLNLPTYILAGVGLCFAYDKFGFNAAVIAHVTNNIYAIIVTLIGL